MPEIWINIMGQVRSMESENFTDYSKRYVILESYLKQKKESSPDTIEANIYTVFFEGEKFEVKRFRAKLKIFMNQPRAGVYIPSDGLVSSRSNMLELMTNMAGMSVFHSSPSHNSFYIELMDVFNSSSPDLMDLLGRETGNADPRIRIIPLMMPISSQEDGSDAQQLWDNKAIQEFLKKVYEERDNGDSQKALYEILHQAYKNFYPHFYDHLIDIYMDLKRVRPNIFSRFNLSDEQFFDLLAGMDHQADIFKNILAGGNAEEVIHREPTLYFNSDYEDDEWLEEYFKFFDRLPFEQVFQKVGPNDYVVPAAFSYFITLARKDPRVKDIQDIQSYWSLITEERIKESPQHSIGNWAYRYLYLRESSNATMITSRLSRVLFFDVLIHSNPEEAFGSNPISFYYWMGGQCVWKLKQKDYADFLGFISAYFQAFSLPEPGGSFFFPVTQELRKKNQAILESLPKSFKSATDVEALLLNDQRKKFRTAMREMIAQSIKILDQSLVMIHRLIKAYPEEFKRLKIGYKDYKNEIDQTKQALVEMRNHLSDNAMMMSIALSRILAARMDRPLGGIDLNAMEIKTKGAVVSPAPASPASLQAPVQFIPKIISVRSTDLLSFLAETPPASRLETRTSSPFDRQTVHTLGSL